MARTRQRSIGDRTLMRVAIRHLLRQPHDRRIQSVRAGQDFIKSTWGADALLAYQLTRELMEREDELAE